MWFAADARALLANALAEQVKDPPGLLMPLRGHASTTRLPVRVDRCAWHSKHSNILPD